MNTLSDSSPHGNDFLKESIKGLLTKLDRIERSIVRLRHARFTGLMVILVLGMAMGVLATIMLFSAKYREGQTASQRWRLIQTAGIEISLKNDRESVWLTVCGDRPMRDDGKLVRNSERQAVGASLHYGLEGER